MSGNFYGGQFFGSGFFGPVGPPPPAATPGGPGGLITFLAWRPDATPALARKEEVRLEKRITKKQKQLKAVEKKIAIAEKKPVEGILVNPILHQRAAELRRTIELDWVDLQSVKDFLGKLDFEEDDEDEWILFL